MAAHSLDRAKDLFPIDRGFEGSCCCRLAIAVEVAANFVYRRAGGFFPRGKTDITIRIKDVGRTADNYRRQGAPGSVEHGGVCREVCRWSPKSKREIRYRSGQSLASDIDSQLN